MEKSVDFVRIRHRVLFEPDEAAPNKPTTKHHSPLRVENGALVLSASYAGGVSAQNQ